MENNRVPEIHTLYNERLKRNLEFQNVIAGYRELPIDEESEIHDKIPDLLLSMSLLSSDLAICNKHLLIYKQEEHSYQMKYFSRALVMHIVDILDDGNTSKLLNRVKSITDIYHQTENLQESSVNVQTTRKKLLEIKKKNLSYLKEIRNNIFAHRDKKGIEQYDDINKIDDKKIALLGADIEELFDTIMDELMKIQVILYTPANEKSAM